jgi:hypothetical protein
MQDGQVHRDTRRSRLNCRIVGAAPRQPAEHARRNDDRTGLTGRVEALAVGLVERNSRRTMDFNFCGDRRQWRLFAQETWHLMASMRFHVDPRDVPPSVAARALGLSLEAFTQKLPALLDRRFPPPDPTTGNFDIRAIEQWQNLRHPQLLGVDKPAAALDASVGLRERLRGQR